LCESRAHDAILRSALFICSRPSLSSGLGSRVSHFQRRKREMACELHTIGHKLDIGKYVHIRPTQGKGCSSSWRFNCVDRDIEMETRCILSVQASGLNCEFSLCRLNYSSLVLPVLTKQLRDVRCCTPCMCSTSTNAPCHSEL
jgi:hypothetical protein